MALLEVKSVSKSFGALKAVNDVSFTVEDGEVFGIAGPNGSGKSTLFNAITKIPFGPDNGDVIFAGTSLQNLAAHEISRAGLVRTFQREMSFASLNVYENAWLPWTNGRSDNHDDLEAALHLMGFSQADFVRPSNNLSVYDRKRLMLASALACRPRLILLDEPASGLTKPEIEETIILLRRVLDQGIAILLIEHVLPFLMSLSGRLLVLNNGQVIGMGDPQSTMRDPRVIEAYLGTRKV